MRSPISSLEALPTELLQQIASFTNPSTTLSLSLVSHTLRTATYDARVFHAHFRDQEWARRHLHARSVPIDVVARYALAEERATPAVIRSLFLRKDDDATVYCERTYAEALAYLPCLAMLGCECVREWGEEPIMHAYGVPVSLTKWRLAFGLYMACARIREAEEPLESAFGHAERLHSEGVRRTQVSFRLYSSSAMDFQVHCLLNIGNFAFIIARVEREHQTGRRQHITIRPPKLSQFPFVSSLVTDIPLPFAQDPAVEWSTYLDTLRRDMARPDCLCTGAWQGYYSYIYAPARFDGPMVDIRFSEPPGEEAGSVSARGTDSVGPFTFSGIMHEDGLLAGSKRYSTHSIYWNLSMTPFGLYGLWSTSFDNVDSRNIGGAVWLWKKEWTED